MGTIPHDASTDEDGNDDQVFVQRLFLRILGRSAEPSELRACLDFLKSSEKPKHNLVLVLLNHNDFVTIR